MGQWASCLTGGTVCLALPCKGRAAAPPPPLQMSPRLGVCVCVCVKGGGGSMRVVMHSVGGAHLN